MREKSLGVRVGWLVALALIYSLRLLRLLLAYLFLIFIGMFVEVADVHLVVDSRGELLRKKLYVAPPDSNEEGHTVHSPQFHLFHL
jgi:hypothetical protein